MSYRGFICKFLHHTQGIPLDRAEDIFFGMPEQSQERRTYLE